MGDWRKRGVKLGKGLQAGLVKGSYFYLVIIIPMVKIIGKVM